MPHVPVWVASGGPQMFELTARYAEGWNMAGGGTDPGATREKYEGFAAACRAAGKDPKELDVCKQTFVGVAPDEAAKKRMTEELAAKNKTTPEGLAERILRRHSGQGCRAAARLHPGRGEPSHLRNRGVRRVARLAGCLRAACPRGRARPRLKQTTLPTAPTPLRTGEGAIGSLSRWERA